MEAGITTAEYAVGTAAGAGFAGLLYTLLTGAFRRPAAGAAVQARHGPARHRVSAVWSRGRRTRPESGAATAELALGIPLLVALTAGLVWMLAVGAAQVRVIDASREAARAVARGDDVAAAQARGPTDRSRGCRACGSRSVSPRSW